MISGEKIAHYIKHPQEIERTALQDLKGLLEKYPFCSSLHLLHLKGLALNHDLSFEHELAKAAIHAADRNHLYTLIHSNPERIVYEQFLEKVESNDTEPLDEKENVSEAIIQPTVNDETLILKEAETKVIEEATTLQKEELILEETILEEVKIEIPSEKIDFEEDTDFEEKYDRESIELDEGILTHAIDLAFVDSGIEKLITPAQESINTEKSTEQNPALEEVEENSIAKETAKTRIVEKTDETIDTAPKSFVEWLKQKQNQPLETALEAKDIETEADEEEEEDQERKKEAVNHLLEKFITEQPTISRPVKDFYSPVKNAKESIEESDDMVTETLAKIYVLQKNYSKAISAYQKLMLVYPEKKTFFASRIENLREEQKKR